MSFNLHITTRARPASGGRVADAAAAPLAGEPPADHDAEPTHLFRVTYTKGPGESGGYPIMKVCWTVIDDHANAPISRM